MFQLQLQVPNHSSILIHNAPYSLKINRILELLSTVAKTTVEGDHFTMQNIIIIIYLFFCLQTVMFYISCKRSRVAQKRTNFSAAQFEYNDSALDSTGKVFKQKIQHVRRT